MKNRRERKSLSAAPQVGPDVVILINKMQQQLVSLEKKIDILISQPSKPFQSFDRSRHYDKGRQENSFREKSYTQVICSDCKKECQVPFKPREDRPVYCRDCFAKRKADKSFKGNQDNRPRERTFVEAPHFNKKQGYEKREAGQKKKPVSNRREKRSRKTHKLEGR